MQYCPKCRTEYREGFQACSDCGSHLVGQLSDVPDEATPDDSLISVFDPPDPMIGQALEALLNDNDIRCVLKSEQIPAYADVAMMLRPRWGQLLVLERDQARAEDLTQGYLSAPEEPEGEE